MDGININESIERMFDGLFEAIPIVLGVLAILLVGYFIALALKKATRTTLHKLGLDDMFEKNQIGQYVQKIVASPSRFVGRVVFWLTMFGAVTVALATFEVNTFDSILTGLYGYIPNILAAFLIFVVAGLVSSGVSGVINRTMGNTGTGKIAQAVVPAVIMSISVFMILTQLNIATEIVVITYASLMGSLALGLALAFGLGGRTVAAKMLDSAYNAGVRNADRVKSDIAEGKANAKREGKRVKDKVKR